MSPEQLKEHRAKAQELSNELKAKSALQSTNPALVCPHCQTKGFVHIKSVKRKKGISGAKATGALLTGGLSMLATGLSRKEAMTQAHCDNCNSTWDF